MFTTKTISALDACFALYSTACELNRQTNLRPCFQDLSELVSPPAMASVSVAGWSVEALLLSVLVQALESAVPLFAGSAFAAPLASVIANLRANTSAAASAARVDLEQLLSQAAAWLQQEHESTLPLKKFVVASAFGDIEVLARTPVKARAEAVALMYKEPADRLDGDVLREFRLGVEVQDK